MFVFYVRQFYDTRIPYCMSHVFLLTRPFDVIMAKSEFIQMEMTDHIHWTQRVTTIQARPWRCQWCSRRYCHESSRRCLVWLQYLLGFRHPAALRMHLRISSSTTSLIIVDWPTEPEIEREKNERWQFWQLCWGIICINISQGAAKPNTTICSSCSCN